MSKRSQLTRVEARKLEDYLEARREAIESGTLLRVELLSRVQTDLSFSITMGNVDGALRTMSINPPAVVPHALLSRDRERLLALEKAVTALLRVESNLSGEDREILLKQVGKAH
jgi:hypothetical protein